MPGIKTPGPLSDGYGVIIPSALLRTPGGRTFKGNGLRPDIAVVSGRGWKPISILLRIGNFNEPSP
jgi:C-terminal processing protease CtpA/Prc